MSEAYSYSPLNGILRSLFDKNSNYYVDNISILQRNEGQNKKDYAFNFNNANYCYSNNIGFCFKRGNVYLTHYEIEVQNGTCKPSIWSFAGSNDGIHWKHSQTENHTMGAYEKFHVAWNYGPYRCFKITSIEPLVAACGTNFDIRQIELFGTYFPNGFKKCTILRRRSYFSISTSFITFMT